MFGLAIVLMTFFLFSVVYAPLATLSTGYAITSNYEGVDVPAGATVEITALTINQAVTQVTFRWHEPPDGNGPVAREVTIPVVYSGEDYTLGDGTTVPILEAVDSYNPTVLGDWGVQAFFRDDGGSTRSGLDNVFSIRARSFNTVPEIPLGTIGASAIIVGALALFAVKQRRKGTAKNK